MDIQENRSEDRCIITHYTSNSITIDQHAYHDSLLLRANHCETLVAQSLSEITPDILRSQVEQHTEIVLIGTGHKTLPLPAPILDYLSQQKLPFEYMRTESAIRTYNTLVHDGRNVTALLIQNR